jgi:surface antigen
MRLADKRQLTKKFDFKRVGRTKMKNLKALLGLLVAGLLMLSPSEVSAKGRLQCVPFARQLSGVIIHGNAKTWWAQALGRYDRGDAPRTGAVLSLPGFGKMHNGHVAVVSKILNPREILISHANWSNRGGIERDVRAVDVSDKGNWSKVKIWFAANRDLGTTSYPANGFIYINSAGK